MQLINDILYSSVGKADLLCQNAPEYARKVLTDFSTDSRNGASLLEGKMSKLYDEKIQCRDCKEIKPLDCFNKKLDSKDGVTQPCKLCKKIYNLRHRDREKNNIQSKEYYNTHKIAVLNRIKKYKARVYKTEWGKIKNRAYAVYGHHKRLGLIDVKPCEVCGAKAEAHHDDYSKPLEVKWLCSKHHRRVHCGLHA
jgi:hypothetical protein